MGLTEPQGLELEGQGQGVFPGSYSGGEVPAGSGLEEPAALRGRAPREDLVFS